MHLPTRARPSGKRVKPLALTLGSELVLPCDVEEESDMDHVFEALGDAWGGIDFVVHAIAFSDKEELKGRYVDTSRENFVRTMAVSCFSFTSIARRAAPMMNGGGSLLTLTYSGSERVMPNYNVMGVAKSALEASVRYLAQDLGPDGIRVNALSAGPMRTLAGSAIGDAREVLKWNQIHAPLRRNVTLEEVGAAALYLLSGLASGVTGESSSRGQRLQHHRRPGQEALIRQLRPQPPLWQTQGSNTAGKP